MQGSCCDRQTSVCRLTSICYETISARIPPTLSWEIAAECWLPAGGVISDYNVQSGLSNVHVGKAGN